MKNLLIWLMLVLCLSAAVSAGDIIGSECKGSIMDTKQHESCRQQTNFIVGANLLSDSCDFVMTSVEKSSKGYLDVDDADDLPGELRDLKNKVGVIAGALILFALVYSGLMYIISPSDPKRRSIAKGYMISCIYMMVFVTAIAYVTSLAYDLSFKSAAMVDDNIDSFLSKAPWKEYADSGSKGSSTVSSAYGDFKSIATVAPVFIIIGWFYIILMYLRNMVIMLLTVLSALLVFLFFFKPTKAFGTVLFALYGVELFVPVLFFPVFKVAGTMFTGDAKIDIGIMASALASAIILHIVLVAVAIVKSASLRWGDD